MADDKRILLMIAATADYTETANRAARGSACTCTGARKWCWCLQASGGADWGQLTLALAHMPAPGCALSVLFLCSLSFRACGEGAAWEMKVEGEQQGA